MSDNNCSNSRNSVIPAEAGIQLIKTASRSESTSRHCPLRGVFVLLDTGLRRYDGLMDYLE